MDAGPQWVQASCSAPPTTERARSARDYRPTGQGSARRASSTPPTQTTAEGHYIYYFLGDRRRAPVVSLGQGFNLGPWGQIRLVGDAVGSYRGSPRD